MTHFFFKTIISEGLHLFWIEIFVFWFHCEEKARDLGMVAADDAQQEAIIGSDLCRLRRNSLQDCRYCKLPQEVSEDHFDGPLQDQTGEIHESNSHL